jgi:hypothetical protein
MQAKDIRLNCERCEAVCSDLSDRHPLCVHCEREIREEAAATLSESEIEQRVDRAVMRRLATDRAYLNATNADAQAEREQAITDEELARVH